MMREMMMMMNINVVIIIMINIHLIVNYRKSFRRDDRITQAERIDSK